MGDRPNDNLSPRRDLTMGNALHRGSATLHPCLCYVALTGLYIGTLTTQGLRPYGLTPACVLSPLQGYKITLYSFARIKTI